MGRSFSGRSYIFDSPPCPIGTASYGDRGGDKVGRPNAHNRRAEEQKEDGGDVLFSVLRIEGEKEKEEFRTKLESLWCSLKHLAMALVHCDETVEKLIRRLEYHLQSGDMEKAKELSEKVKELYEVRQSIRNFIKMLLFDISKKLGSAPQVRCREDLCTLE